MKKIRIGILSPSNIAFNRFLPSLTKSRYFDYAGLALADETEWFKSSGGLSDELAKLDGEKSKRFVEKFGGNIFDSYAEMLNAPDIDAVYIPLPPALHFEWAKKALEKGKHVLLEKPFTTKIADTKELIRIAKERNIALHENYMFEFHHQMKHLRTLIESDEFGEIRGYKLSFGFPRLSKTDFRYNESMGGGAVLDCGGYPVKLATLLLGEKARVVYARLDFTDEFEVDLFGSVVMENETGLTAHIMFGMDNAYQCQLEAWGSKQTIIAPRIFTAGSDVEPRIIVRSSTDETIVPLECDDQFLHSIEHFYNCINDNEARNGNYDKIIKQSQMIQHIVERAGR